MIGRVVVMEPSAYQQWLSGGGTNPGGTLTMRGEQLFQQLACVSCHVNDGSGRGPSLAGVFGRTVTLADGRTVTADETYVRESILTPQAKLVAGYGPIMPTFQGQVSEESLMSLIEYVKAQSGRGPAQASATVPPEPASTGGTK
jgi:cytochrome c oxidase subunit 2